ncbi:DNA internalization-related competence protein ComEC/Rec2 [Glaciecola sp. SC05]|uniref:DNA internalization-related competence protein ComEC/Rec2 n=1 Tax=Glaciecola sp. SC05 TaxID=1987355 RepID=UPI003527E441
MPHVSLIIIASVLAFLCIYFSLSASLSGALLGFVWASSMGYWYTAWQLNSNILNQNVLIEGRVTSISPAETAKTQDENATFVHQAIRFNIQINKLGKQHLRHSPQVRLSWYRSDYLPKQGQSFRLLVNLKAPSGLANPHTFHYQTWLASKNIVATGYVIDSNSNQVLDEQLSFRQQSIDAMRKIELPHSSWLQALSFGYRGELSDQDWELLQKSGTAHLFAISGLHVGIVFGYCLFFVSKPLAISSALLGFRQYQIGKASAAVAAVLCLVYAYLAGFEIPVLRAILALLFWTYLLITGSHWRLPAVLLYLITSFFILFPFSILGVSFWFSFIAVLSIWLFVWRFMPSSSLTFWKKVKYTVYLQIWLCVITMPLTLYVFGQLPVFALFANLLLVPWVSFVLVPLCLLGTFSMIMGLPCSFYTLIFKLADDAMELTLLIMRQTVETSDAFAIERFYLGSLSLSIMVVALILCLLPFWRYKKRLIVFCMCVLIVRSQTHPFLHPTLVIFDVGQGSSALLRFKNAQMKELAWLFDTGASFPSGFSMAEAVILPTLQHHQISTLELIFLSHLDNDHAGGMTALRRQTIINHVLSPQNMCSTDALDPRQLKQVGMQLQVLWPLSPEDGQENNHSCVITLEINGTRILFAGDIEREAEQALLKIYKESGSLKSDILIAPHHGSRTSSTDDFVTAVSPRYVVFSAGHPNRWGFPHDEVVQRYQRLDSQIFHTGKQGAVEFVFAPNKTKVQTYREHGYNRWYFKAPN